MRALLSNISPSSISPQLYGAVADPHGSDLFIHLIEFDALIDPPLEVTPTGKCSPLSRSLNPAANASLVPASGSDSNPTPNSLHGIIHSLAL